MVKQISSEVSGDPKQETLTVSSRHMKKRRKEKKEKGEKKTDDKITTQMLKFKSKRKKGSHRMATISQSKVTTKWNRIY